MHMEILEQAIRPEFKNIVKGGKQRETQFQGSCLISNPEWYAGLTRAQKRELEAKEQKKLVFKDALDSFQ